MSQHNTSVAEYPRSGEHRRNDPLQRWNPMPTLVGAAAAIAFARDHLGVCLTPTMLKNATQQRHIKVYKISARNVYSEAGVVDYVESLARPVNSPGEANK